MAATRIRVGRFVVEWDSERLQVRLPGSPWADALLLGGGIFGSIYLISLWAFFLGWRDGWKMVFFLVPAGLLLGGLAYRFGKDSQKFAIEAFLTGERRVRVRLFGDPKELPAGEITAFETVPVTYDVKVGVAGSGTRSSYGIELRSPKGDLILIPGRLGSPRHHCEAIGAILDALVLRRSTMEAALAKAGSAQGRDRWVIVAMLAILAGLIGWLVYFFRRF